MTRPARAKVAYAAIAVVGVVGVLLAWKAFAYRWEAGLVLAAVLLLPGRIQARLWRDFYVGLRHLKAGRGEASIAAFTAFRERLRARPGLKRWILCSWAFWTRDVGAMTAHNLGIAALRLGRPEEARLRFNEALAEDPGYALPHAALAELEAGAGNAEAARAHVARAVELGYPPPEAK
jgi:tetratricopeptide (TPR) repeat protein